jgi:hypothetical protein
MECLIFVIAAVSHFPGGVALQPSKRVAMQSSKAEFTLTIYSVRNVNRHFHRSVTLPAKVRAFSLEGAGSFRVELYFRSFALL